MNEISIQQGQVSTRTSVRETADACDQKEMSVRNALGLLFCDSRLIHQFIWCVSGEKKKVYFLKNAKNARVDSVYLGPMGRAIQFRNGAETYFTIPCCRDTLGIMICKNNLQL